VRNIATEGVKIRIRDLDELKQRLRTEWAKLDHVVIASAFVSGVVDSSRSVMSLLQYFPHTVTNGLKSGESEDHSCSGINSGVSFGNNW